MTTRFPFSLVLAILLGACGLATTLSPEDQASESGVSLPLPTELNAASVLAHAPMVDTARVAGVVGYVAVLGLLNQTAPCFGIESDASRNGRHITVRIVSRQVDGTCATFAAGAYDYDVGVKGLAPGQYDVDVVHRILFNDGRVAQTTVATRRVEVR